MNFKAILGVAGVHHSEKAHVRQIGRGFELLVLFALIAVFAQLLTGYLGDPFQVAWLSDLTWSVFALELVVNLYLVKDKLRYLRENWLSVVIVLVAFPLNNWGVDWAIIVRSLRLILFVRFFAAFFKDASIILNKNRFGHILLVFAFIIVGSGAVFAYIEERSFIEGIWYAIVTITTVGYGDVVPVSDSGRIFGAVLILFGVVFFSLVSANIAAFLIGSDQRKSEREILLYVKATEKRLAAQSEQNERHVEQLMVHMSKEIEELKKDLIKEHRK
ncbi:MAG: voltage-gated potassium channel [Thiomicrorhabdus sp.]|nr:MAG: voltage-gated potassium channel [Thiomicrorhabdus sp.]